jgi:hypothetical protein
LLRDNGTLFQTNVNFGTIFVTGPIESFAVGGQKFWLDDVCVEHKFGPEIFDDGFESGNTPACSSTVP